jgi:23S rRNA (adenine2030-N6)-methyltransferase
MNYRHAFHAGNFADVFKHVLLARILVHLRQKETPFRVFDTHAGAGAYRLDSNEAERTREWVDGVGRVLDAPFEPAAHELLEPWLSFVRGLVARDPPIYPGSPLLAQHLARAQDRLVFCEKHGEDARSLRATFQRDRRVSAFEGDGWSVLAARLPPPERRGLVLIDPPFEQAREFAVIIEGLQTALRRWASGIYAVWYPIKARREVDAFSRRVAGLPAGKMLRIEIGLYDVERVDRLNGCGLIVINPPWRLDEEGLVVAKALAQWLAREGRGRHRVEWLKGE